MPQKRKSVTFTNQRPFKKVKVGTDGPEVDDVHYTKRKTTKTSFQYDSEFFPKPQIAFLRGLKTNMPFVAFMKHLTKPKNLKIIEQDVLSEIRLIIDNDYINPLYKGKHKDRVSKLSVVSINVMAAIEFTYENEDCNSVVNCMKDMIKNQINSYKDFKELFIGNKADSVSIMQKFYKAIFPNEWLSNDTISGAKNNTQTETTELFRSAATTEKSPWYTKWLKKHLENSYTPQEKQKFKLGHKKNEASVEVRVKTSEAGAQIYSLLRASLIRKGLKEAAAIYAQKKQTARQLMPIKIQEAQIYGIVQFFKRTIGRGCWQTYGNNDDGQSTLTSLKKGILTTDKFQKDGKITDAGLAATMLCQLCIGSRSRGIVLANRISRVQEELKNPKMAGGDEKDDEDDDGLPTGDVKDAIEKVKSGFFNTYDNMLLVDRLSKEGSESTKLSRQIKANSEEVEVDDKNLTVLVNAKIVKPTLWMFLSGDEFIEIFHTLRQALTIIMQSTSSIPKNSYTVDKKTKMFVIKDEMLYSKPLSKFGTSITSRCRQLFIKFLKSKGWEKELLRHNNVVHLLRKIYVSYGYQMFSSDRMKDLAFAKYVLAHKSLSVSLTYTALMIQMTLRPQVSLTSEMSRVLTDMKQSLSVISQRVTTLEKSGDEDDFDKLGFSDPHVSAIQKLPRKIFTTEEKKQSKDTERVLKILRTWPKKGIKLTASNMSQLGIGKNLILKVRRTAEFKKLNS